MAVTHSSLPLICPLCRCPLQQTADHSKFACPTCHNAVESVPRSGRLDFGAFLSRTESVERERVGLAYRFYALAYAPLALLNMLTVWRASLGPLIRHYAAALDDDTQGPPAKSFVQDLAAPILDIAVGDGALTLLALKRLGRPVFAPHLCLDIADDMLVTAERNLAGIPGLRTVRADAGALPFADGSCSRVCCYGGLHVIAHPGKAAREMRRVLRHGGLFSASILLTPPGPISGHLARRYVDLGFLSTNFTWRSALGLLEGAGFTDLCPQANGRMMLVTGRAG